MTAGAAGGERLLVRAAIATSVVLFALRLHVLRGLGFGDAEALYACYALHPQPAYVDHPGLVGSVARLIGHGTVPDPESTHLFSATVATFVPWLGGAAARACGASRVGWLSTVLALALLPELAIGLFALTPDLLLAVFWLGALGAAAVALRSEPKSFRALAATLATAVLAALGCLAKVTGALLAMALVATLLTRSARDRLRTIAPWAALVVGAVLVMPLVLWEARRGLPMLFHRLVSTQAEAGFSLRNLGALVGGQLAYVTPFFLWGAFVIFVDLWRHRRDAIDALLLLATVLPGLALVVLCLWSKVAEPHWVAPLYLPLALHYARRPELVPRLIAIGSLVSGVVAVLLAWALVRTPVLAKLERTRYEPRYDLTNDLYAWGPGRELVVDAVERAMVESASVPIVVGPHYVVCAQAHAALGALAPVGCNSPIRDDFDDWLPREKWLSAKVVIWVDDSRFAERDATKELPGRIVRDISKVEVRRGGVRVRTIRAVRLESTSGVAGADRSR